MLSEFLQPSLTPRAVIARIPIAAESLKCALTQTPTSIRIGVVSSLYDTGFCSLESQLRVKLEQLKTSFSGLRAKVEFLLVTPDAAAVDATIQRVSQELNTDWFRVSNVTVDSDAWIAKGAHLRRGISHFLNLEAPPDYICYLNLNVKLHAGHVVDATRLLIEGADFVAGTRVPGRGGGVIGAGFAGRLKSVVYNFLVRQLFSDLNSIFDTNAPLKMGRLAVWRRILDCGCIEDVSFDSEWLLIVRQSGFKLAMLPVLWIQQSGSKPPWSAIPGVLWSLGWQFWLDCHDQYEPLPPLDN